MFIPVGEAQIFSTAFGRRTAPAILGIGGWIGSWELWQQPFSVLSQHWHTLAYDHRGSGATLAPTPSITYDNLVGDLFAVMDAYGLKRCVVAAESAGAITALGAALKHPERISGLVIVDGRDPRSKNREEDPFYVGLQTDYTRTLEGFVEACVPEPGCEPIKRWGRQILGRATPEAALALYRLNPPDDLQHNLHHIQQPTLLIHGSADLIASLEGSRWLSQVLPNSRLVIMEGAGHVPTMTKAADVAREIGEFFKEAR